MIEILQKNRRDWLKLYFKVNDKEPIYMQIIRHIKVSLVIGTLLPGDIIPSRRELAEMLKVNPNTVQRAYREMEGSRLIETVRNFPSKITTNENIIKAVKEELLKDSIDTFINSMKELKISKEDVINIIKENY